MHDELPHSIAVTTEEVEERRTAAGEPLLALRVIVRVERDSQKGIVIGRRGAVIGAAATAARHELEALLGHAGPHRDPRDGRPRLAAPGDLPRPPRALIHADRVRL